MGKKTVEIELVKTAASYRRVRMAEGIKAGNLWINTYRQVSFLTPFGGFKDSGLGRENGIDGVKEYLEVKSVWINTGAPTPNPYAPR